MGSEFPKSIPARDRIDDLGLRLLLLLLSLSHVKQCEILREAVN